jgi:hypothetical protein
MTVASKFKKQYSVQLYVSGRDLNPAEVGRLLDLEPGKYSHRDGDPNKRTDGQVEIWDGGFCSFTSDPAVAPGATYEMHISWMLEQLEPKLSLIQEWLKGGWEVALTVLTLTEVRGGGPKVSAELMMRLARLGIPIEWKTVANVQAHEFSPED